MATNVQLAKADFAVSDLSSGGLLEDEQSARFEKLELMSAGVLVCVPPDLEPEPETPTTDAECEPDGPEGDEPDEVDEDPGPIIRTFRRDTGWIMTGSEPEECTSNHHREQDGRPPCTDPAVWRVVEDCGMHLNIAFYCDADLPDEHRPSAAD